MLPLLKNIANLFIDAGIVTLASFISPNSKDRELVRETVGDDFYVEVYVSTSLEECEKRDVKGLYLKARSGEIKNMTGISAPYEVPNRPDIIINTETDTLNDSVEKILNYISNKLYG